jgi:hypothetical protein
MSPLSAARVAAKLGRRTGRDRVTISLPAELVDALGQKAKDENAGVSAVAERALIAGLSFVTSSAALAALTAAWRSQIPSQALADSLAGSFAADALAAPSGRAAWSRLDAERQLIEMGLVPTEARACCDLVDWKVPPPDPIAIAEERDRVRAAQDRHELLVSKVVGILRHGGSLDEATDALRFELPPGDELRAIVAEGANRHAIERLPR